MIFSYQEKNSNQWVRISHEALNCHRTHQGADLESKHLENCLHVVFYEPIKEPRTLRQIQIILEEIPEKILLSPFSKSWTSWIAVVKIKRNFLLISQLPVIHHHHKSSKLLSGFWPIKSNNNILCCKFIMNLIFLMIHTKIVLTLPKLIFIDFNQSLTLFQMVFIACLSINLYKLVMLCVLMSCRFVPEMSKTGFQKFSWTILHLWKR